MRIEQVELQGETALHALLDYYMGKNTPERQEFIIKNLRLEEELIVDATQKAEETEEEFAENA
jgi:topoisomerase-4 subunit B